MCEGGELARRPRVCEGGELARRPRVCEGGELARRPKVSSNEPVPYSPYAKHYGPWILIKVVLILSRYWFKSVIRSR